MTITADAPSVGAVLLAAGAGRRAGTQKLLLSIQGEPLVRRAACAIASLAPLVVVTNDPAVARALEGLGPLRVVPSPRAADGLSASLTAGLDALDADVSAALVALGDMPFVRREDIARLLAAWRPEDLAVVPVHAGRRGHPVILTRALFDEVRALEGDVGARAILERHRTRVREVPIDHDGVLRDVDRAADLS